MKYYKITNVEGKEWVMPELNMGVGMMLYQPSAWRGKLVKNVLPWLSWSGMVRKALHIEETECPVSDALDRRLKEIYKTARLEYSAFNGTPCAHQKRTIQICQGKKILGYCKISDKEEIIELFKREQIYLQWLESNEVANVPRCLACEEIDDHKWMFQQSTTKTTNSQVDHLLGPLELGFLEQLEEKTQITCPLEDTDQYKSLKRIGDCVDRFQEQDKAIIQQGISEVLNYYKVSGDSRFSAYHSDFTPWNMFVEQGQLFVFDWEYAGRSYMPYLDLVHFLFQTCFFERHAEAEAIYGCLIVENIGLLRRYFKDVRIAVIAYLLDIIGMYALRDEGYETNGPSKLLTLRIEVLRQLVTNNE